MYSLLLLLVIQVWIILHQTNNVQLFLLDDRISHDVNHPTYADQEEIDIEDPKAEMACQIYDNEEIGPNNQVISHFVKFCTSASESNLFHYYNRLLRKMALFHYEEFEKLEFVDSSIRRIPNGIFDIPRIDETNQILEILSFTNVHLRQIENNALSKLSNLKRLYLNKNRIGVLQPGALNGLSKLIDLDISENKLTGILDKRNFTGVGVLELQFLDLSWNYITVVTKDCFTEFKNLSSINLSYNSLITLPSSLFHYNRKLADIFLNNNNISEIGNNTFPSSVISNLNLSFNNISNILIKSFGDQNLTKLVIENLVLDYNSLTNMSDLFNILRVDDFSVKNNYIQEINNGHFCGQLDLNDLGLKSLTNISMCNTGTTLIASHNQLQEIPNWREMKAVEMIQLQHNNISEIALGRFHDCQNLTTLRLDQNIIGNLDIGVFSGLANLKSLNISFNKITSIDKHLMYGLNNLEELYLGGNLLTTLPILDMSKWLKSLKSLGLNGNHWNCLKLAEILEAMNERNIEVVHHGIADYHVTNLGGIRCWNDLNFTKQNIPKISLLDTTETNLIPKMDKFDGSSIEETSSEAVIVDIKEIAKNNSESKLIKKDNAKYNLNSIDISKAKILPEKIIQEKFEQNYLVQQLDMFATIKENKDNLQAIRSGVYELKNVFIIIVILLCCMICMKIYKFYKQKARITKVAPSVCVQSFTNEIEI